MKIIYFSNSLGNTSQGGSSLSGLHFLEMLKKYFNSDVTVFSDSAHNSLSLLKHPWIKFIPTENKLIKYNFKAILKFAIKGLCNKFLCSKFYDLDLENLPSILFVNSFTNITEHVSFHNSENLIKVCVVRGDVDSFNYQGDPKYFHTALGFLNQFDYLIYISKGIQNNWNKLLDIPNYYLPNSINEDTNYEASKNPYLKNTINIAFVGSIQYRKGQLRLAEIMHWYEDTNVYFHLFGRLSSNDGGEDILKKLSKFKNIIFHYHTEDVGKYIYHSDLCILLSYSEAFPRTIAEYLYYGKPIISTNVSGALEMVSTGSNGYIIDNNDLNFYQHLIKLVDSIIYDKELQSKFGLFSKKLYEENFTSEKQYELLSHILEDISVRNL